MNANTCKPGTQRLSIEQLQKWEALKFGMFIHYGMSTYTGSELPDGSHPSTLYAPDNLDVDQWVSVARVSLAFTTREYQDFQSAQIEELLTHYGKVGEVWIDIPTVLPRFYRQELYHQISSLQPDAGPDKHGLIPPKYVGALQRLRANLDRLNVP
ncbi:MAG: hypothetical protein NTV93_09270 [Verrucomicrobia bacterium]|nr:hypothetical protein [Verrucomicrobiota bacterium]